MLDLRLDRALQKKGVEKLALLFLIITAAHAQKRLVPSADLVVAEKTRGLTRRGSKGPSPL